MHRLTLVLFLASCSGEAQPASPTTPADDPPETEAEAEAETEPPTSTEEDETAEVAAGAYLWEEGPFPELTHAEALAHCAERGRRLLAHNEMLGEHVRHIDVLRVSGVFWTAGVSQLEPSEAYAMELNIPEEDGPMRAGAVTHPRSESHLVRCARDNPNPPPAEEEPGSCDTIDDDSECVQHDAEAFANLGPASRATACTSFGGGTYRREPCPTEGLVGRCPIGGGQLTHYYDRGGSPYDRARAEQDCVGEFEPVE